MCVSCLCCVLFVCCVVCMVCVVCSSGVCCFVLCVCVCVWKRVYYVVCVCGVCESVGVGMPDEGAVFYTYRTLPTKRMVVIAAWGRTQKQTA